MIMEAKDLLKHCRYYKGEDICPFLDDLFIRRILWEVEKTWVEEYVLIDKNEDHAITPNIDKWVDDFVIHAPLGKKLPWNSPRFLDAAIFSVFLHNNELPIFDEFIVFYKKWDKMEL